MAFAILILLNEGIEGKFRKPLFRTLFLILFFQVIIVLLSSKAGIIGMAVGYLVFLVYVLVERKVRSVRTLTILGFIFISFGITLYMSPSTKGRFNELKESTTNQGQENAKLHDGSSIRVIAWKTSLELIKEKPVTGFGVGDVNPRLIQKYEELGYDYLMEMKVDPHNQYLQMMLAAGIPGLIILLSSFLFPAYFAFRKKKILYLAFILVFMAHNIVESMLERQGGVVYYAFFNLFLFYISFIRQDHHKEKNHSGLSESVKV
jgi:O-antigen ligase